MIIELLNQGLASPGERHWRGWIETGKAVQVGNLLVMAQADRINGVYYPSVTIYDLDYQAKRHTLMVHMANLAALGEPYVVLPRAIDRRDGPPRRVFWEICNVEKQIVKSFGLSQWYWASTERWYVSKAVAR